MAEIQMMSDIEEPPTKVTKLDMAVTGAPDEAIEGTEHSQEEWLSEGVLTDDDYNQTMEQSEQTFSNIGNNSQDESQSTNIDSLENTDDPEIEYTEQAELDGSQVNSENLQNDSLNNTENLPTDYQESVENVQIEFQDNVENQVASQDNSENKTVEYQDHMNFKIGSQENTEITQTEEQAILNTVEETLNNFENDRQTMETSNVQAGSSETFTEDLSMFLIKKTEIKEGDHKDKQEGDNDDGNDTDELLRMLGEDGDEDKKKTLKTVKKSILASQEDSTDDEENIFEGATKITTMKVARNAQIYKRQIPKMAAPESDSDMSSEEERTIKKMFHVKPAQAHPVRTLRSTNKTDSGGNQNSLLKSNFKASDASKPSALSTNVNSANKSPATSTPLRTYSNTRLRKKQPLPMLKEVPKLVKTLPEVRKQEMSKVEVRKPEIRKMEVRKPEMRKMEVRKPDTRKVEVKKPEVSKTLSQQIKYITDEEGLMDDDEDYAMDEELGDSDEELSQLKRKAAKQQLMKPEQMDEDMLSEEESEPSDASFYDEMPSSESEDIDEWFALDIRAERAGDYIPLLGHKANELLTEEKKRVVKKLTILRENIQALALKSKEQTDQIEAARRSLAELDTILTHT